VGGSLPYGLLPYQGTTRRCCHDRLQPPCARRRVPLVRRGLGFDLRSAACHYGVLPGTPNKSDIVVPLRWSWRHDGHCVRARASRRKRSGVLRSFGCSRVIERRSMKAARCGSGSRRRSERIIHERFGLGGGRALGDMGLLGTAASPSLDAAGSPSDRQGWRKCSDCRMQIAALAHTVPKTPISPSTLRGGGQQLGRHFGRRPRSGFAN
jgi:hypothetical protein